jgi:hypothetical protein
MRTQKENNQQNLQTNAALMPDSVIFVKQKVPVSNLEEKS